MNGGETSPFCEAKGGRGAQRRRGFIQPHLRRGKLHERSLRRLALLIRRARNSTPEPIAETTLSTNCLNNSVSSSIHSITHHPHQTRPAALAIVSRNLLRIADMTQEPKTATRYHPAAAFIQIIPKSVRETYSLAGYPSISA